MDLVAVEVRDTRWSMYRNKRPGGEGAVVVRGGGRGGRGGRQPQKETRSRGKAMKR